MTVAIRSSVSRNLNEALSLPVSLLTSPSNSAAAQALGGQHAAEARGPDHARVDRHHHHVRRVPRAALRPQPHGDVHEAAGLPPGKLHENVAWGW